MVSQLQPGDIRMVKWKDGKYYEAKIVKTSKLILQIFKFSLISEEFKTF